GDLGERAAGANRRLARQPRRRARDRVPDAGRSDGRGAARAQARRAARRLRARRLRGSSAEGLRGRARRGARGRDARALPRPPERVRRFARLAGLSGVALAQPLFDLLGRNPEFFSVRGASSGEILVFALVLVLVPPAAFFALELAAGAVSKRAGEAVHLVLVGGLVAFF